MAEEEKQNPLDGIKAEMKRLLAKNWAQAAAKWQESAKRFSPQVEQQASAILADSDIDREAAKLLLNHHKQALDTALDNRDFPTAKREAAETASHKEAAEMLGKPKNHQQRLAFERKQAETASKDTGFNR